MFLQPPSNTMFLDKLSQEAINMFLEVNNMSQVANNMLLGMFNK